MLGKLIEKWGIVLLIYSFLYLTFVFHEYNLNYSEPLEDFDLFDFISIGSFVIYLSLFLNLFSLVCVSLIVYLVYYIFLVDVELKNVLALNLISNVVFFIPIFLETVLVQHSFRKEFSFYSLMNGENLPRWLQYPLVSLNIFELLYVLVFSFLLSKVLRNSLDDNLKVVLISYGRIFFLWIILIMFMAID